MPLPEPFGNFAGREDPGRLVHAQGQAGLEQGGVDMLAEAGPLASGERGEDANGAVEPRPEVGDRNRDAERRALGGSVDAHQSGHAAGDEVEAAAAEHTGQCGRIRRSSSRRAGG